MTKTELCKLLSHLITLTYAIRGCKLLLKSTLKKA